MRMKKRRGYDFENELENQLGRKRKNTEAKKFIKTFIWGLIIAVLLSYFATVFFTKYLPLMTSTNTSFSDLFNKNPFGNKKYVRILMLGCDNTNKKGYGLSDTMVLFTINTQTKEVRALSFPRDTYVEELPTHKLNSALKTDGPQKILSVLEEKFIYPTMIDYYIITSTEGFRGMVDLLGGVYVVVEKDMDYDDNYGNLHIHLKGSPDKQLLNGKDAEGYVRFRKDRFGDSSYTVENGEFVAAGRIARQQKFMMALCNRVISLPSKTERANFLKQCYDKKYIESNLNLQDWNSLADFFVGIKPEEMLMDVLPGEPKMVRGVSYWVTDTEKLPGIVAQDVLFNGDNPKIAVTEDNTDIETAAPSKVPSLVVVKILNGSGVKGLAANVGETLKSQGYSDITTGNANSFDYTQTRIKCKEKAIGLAIKQVIGIGVVTVDNTQTEDVIIIIGKDLSASKE